MILSGLNKSHLPLLCVILLIQACSSSSRYKISQDHGPAEAVDVSHIKDAVPKDEPRSKSGNKKNYEVWGKWYSVLSSSEGYSKQGLASWYGKKFHGHTTASGETYDMFGMTAAHKSLPLPTYVRVTNLKNQRSVIVKVNDRGPFHENRIIDLSYSAAKKLGVVGKGTAKVEVTAINPKTFRKTEAFRPKFKRTSAFSSYPAENDNKLYLQVGAFNDKKNAYKLRKRLSRMFKPSRVHSDFASDKNIYRVRIGPLASVPEANKLSALLIKKGIRSSQIVID